MTLIRQVLIDMTPFPSGYHKLGDSEVMTQFYPASHPFETAGMSAPQLGSPDNSIYFPPAVAKNLLSDLESLARTNEAILWRHAWHCIPEVAVHLPRLFPALRIVESGDDCPQASPRVMSRVARYFNVAVHYMYLYDPATGQLVKDAVYGGLDTRFAAMIGSGWAVGPARTFDIEAKAKKIESGQLPPSLVHVGVMGTRRQPAYAAVPLLVQGGVPCCWSGYPLPFLDPNDCLKAYMGALFGVNVATYSSLYNCRFYDLFAFGVVQIVWDPCGELPAFGFVPGETHLTFDGTTVGLVKTVMAWKDRRADLGRIVRTAHARVQAFLAERERQAALTMVYRDYAEAVARERKRKP